MFARAETPEEFLTHFQWNRERFPSKRASLRTMVDGIIKVNPLRADLPPRPADRVSVCRVCEQEASQADSELKRLTTEYNEVRNSVTAIERKET